MYEHYVEFKFLGTAKTSINKRSY